MKFQADFDQDYIHFGKVQRAVKTGEKDTDFEVIDDVIETDRVNIQDFVQSYKDQVLSAADIVRMSIASDRPIEDYVKPYDDKEQAVDMSAVPANNLDALAKAKTVRSQYSKLPDDLKNGVSDPMDFITGFNKEKFDKFINGRVDQILASRLAAGSSQEVKKDG